MTRKELSLPVRIALGACDAVAGAYPAPFRRRFGPAMRDDFRALAEDRGGRGAGAAAALLARALRDLLFAVPREWARHWGRDPGKAVGEEGTMGGGGAGGLVRGTLQDLRWGLRSLARDRVFSGVTVTVLALGIGANLAVFGLVRAYLIRPLPFPDAERLMAIEPVAPVPWTRADEVFEIPISWDLDAFTLVGDGPPVQVRGAWVAPGFFEAFGIRPALGRGLGRDETGTDDGSVAVISHRLWRERFGGASDVLGRSVATFSADRPDDVESFTIVGVLPADFWFFNQYTDMLVPLRAENPVYMGRLPSGVPPERAARALEDLARPLMEEVPADFSVELVPYQDRYVRNVRPTLVVLWTAVGLVLLIACGNAAVLLLVRAAGRERELSVRRALGAGRGRIARQLLGEGLALAAVAAALGTGLAWLALRFLAAPAQASLGLSAPGGDGAIGMDPALLAVSVALAVATGLVFGAVPLLGAARGRISRALGEGRAGGVTDSRRLRRLRWALVGGELALSCALLVASGLAVRSAVHASSLDLGFEPEGLVKAEVTLRRRSYPEAVDRTAFFDRLVDEARALPGVARAGAVIRVPFTWRINGAPVEAEGREVADPGEAATAVGLIAGPGYVGTMGLPILRGRDLSPEDVEGSEPVVVVSSGLARRLWPGEDPVGRRLREVPTSLDRAHGEAERGPWRTVVGVVPDVRKSLEAETVPDYYAPYAQVTPSTMSVVMRLRPGAPPPIPELERALATLDPTVPLSSVESLAEATRRVGGPARFLAGVLTGFGGFAVVLAVLGLYGVVAYAAARRRRDVAIRMALGADRDRVVRDFVAEGTVVVLGGLALGLIGARLLARLLEGALVGPEPDGPGTYVAVTALLGAAALLATWLPARRAARSDPMTILREE